MKIRDLVNIDAGTAISWLIENQYDFEIVPKEPTQKMLFGVDETRMNEFCSSSRQSTQHEIGKEIYKAMIKRI